MDARVFAGILTGIATFVGLSLISLIAGEFNGQGDGATASLLRPPTLELPASRPPESARKTAQSPAAAPADQAPAAATECCPDRPAKSETRSARLTEPAVEQIVELRRELGLQKWQQAFGSSTEGDNGEAGFVRALRKVVRDGSGRPRSVSRVEDRNTTKACAAPLDGRSAEPVAPPLDDPLEKRIDSLRRRLSRLPKGAVR